MTDDNRSDETLLAAWRTDDARAGDALVRRHSMMLRRYFTLKALPDAVEDLVSRTWAEILDVSVRGRTRPAGSPPREVLSVRAHFLAFARFTLCRYYRERKRENGKELDASVDTIESLEPSLSRQLSWVRQVELVEVVLQSLPIELQEVFEAREVEGLSGPELAELFGIPEGTVRSRLHRARELLKERLATLEAAAAAMRREQT